MNYRIQCCLTLGLFLCASGGRLGAQDFRERNAWPGQVATTFGSPSGQEQSKALGPFVFEAPAAPGQVSRRGFRPFWVESNDQRGNRQILSLYPVFRYDENEEGTRWSLFSLIRHSTPKPKAGETPQTDAFEVWPFYLQRRSPSSGDDYTAVFPLGGSVTNRFGLDRWDFFLFPLYSRSEKSQQVVTQTPWPIFRRIEGGGHHGTELWPLYGQRGREKDYRRSFFLWPLGYSSRRWAEDGGETLARGILPVYAESSGPQHRSQTFLWPFFGYSDRKGPQAYHQSDYLWPLFVQGRGETRTVNRWAPFYTHSTGKGREKTWLLWPLFRSETVRFADLEEKDERLLFFLYRSTTQSKPGAPSAGQASRTHVWPFLSAWEDGRGQTQIQVLSPLEPIFPNQQEVRVSYSPLFALYRYHETAPGHARHALLWDLFTVTREPNRTEWHLGPLLGGLSTPEAGRISMLGGLLGAERGAQGWRPFVFKFQRQNAVASPP